MRTSIAQSLTVALRVAPALSRHAQHPGPDLCSCSLLARGRRSFDRIRMTPPSTMIAGAWARPQPERGPQDEQAFAHAAQKWQQRLSERDWLAPAHGVRWVGTVGSLFTPGPVAVGGLQRSWGAVNASTSLLGPGSRTIARREESKCICACYISSLSVPDLKTTL